MLFHRKTSPIAGSKDSIAELKKIKIGGIDQWILVRGSSRSNPILLFLHGGPGSAQIAVAAKYQSALEQHFIVVNWDQRGSGLSYAPDITKETMTVDQFIQDTKELIDYLIEVYKKQKLYLVGHSWGSMLGILTAQKYPQVIEAFAGVGQAVDLAENEDLAFKYVYQSAVKSNNQSALRELRKIGEPPYADFLRGTKIRGKWTGRFGARFHNITIAEFVLQFLRSREYSFFDGIRFLKGSDFSYQAMWEQLMRINLFELADTLEVPVYFLLGRYDYTTPYDIAVRYYEKLKAPYKEMIWFEQSAHCMPFEEPEKFQSVLIEKMKRTDR